MEKYRQIKIKKQDFPRILNFHKGVRRYTNNVIRKLS